MSIDKGSLMGAKAVVSFLIKGWPPLIFGHAYGNYKWLDVVISG